MDTGRRRKRPVPTRDAGCSPGTVPAGAPGRPPAARPDCVRVHGVPCEHRERVAPGGVDLSVSDADGVLRLGVSDTGPRRACAAFRFLRGVPSIAACEAANEMHLCRYGSRDCSRVLVLSLIRVTSYTYITVILDAMR